MPLFLALKNRVFAKRIGRSEVDLFPDGGVREKIIASAAVPRRGIGGQNDGDRIKKMLTNIDKNKKLESQQCLHIKHQRTKIPTRANAFKF